MQNFTKQFIKYMVNKYPSQKTSLPNRIRNFGEESFIKQIHPLKKSIAECDSIEDLILLELGYNKHFRSQASYDFGY